MRRRVLVVGWDGATWDVLDRLMERGLMPNLERLRSEGVWGTLTSTYPPITGPSWFSMATGMNPGKTGVYDFLTRTTSDYLLHPISSSFIRGKAYWDILSRRGINVGVFAYPMTYPPYPVNGFMVTDPGPRLRAAYVSYPGNLADRIENATGGYEPFVNYHLKKYDDTRLFIEDVNRHLEKILKVLMYLVTDQRWDVFTFVLSCTDWIQHRMWKHFDETYPLYDPGPNGAYQRAFEDLWTKIDMSLGDITAAAGPDTQLILVSDHGFGPQMGRFDIVRWLEMKGYLTLTKVERMKNILLDWMPRRHVGALLGDRLRAKLRRYLPQDSLTDPKTGRAYRIDFAKSKAFLLGHTIPWGFIYLNRKGRDSNGFLGEKEAEGIASDLVSQLKNLSRDIGREIRVDIFRSSEVFWGKSVQWAPDILFMLDGGECVVTKRYDVDLFRNEPYSTRHTGSHRLEGIFVAHGPGIRGHNRVEISINDVAPTILGLVGQHPTAHMDGTPLNVIS